MYVYFQRLKSLEHLSDSAIFTVAGSEACGGLLDDVTKIGQNLNLYVASHL